MSATKVPVSTQKIIQNIVSAIREAKPNQELVRQGFLIHLERLRLPPREVVFHPNFIDACKTVWVECKAAIDQKWDAAWDAARDAAWGAARGAAWGAARDAAWGAAWGAARDAAWGAAANPFTPFIDILHGGCLAFWVTTQAVHVLLGRVYAENRRLHRTDGPAVEYEDGSGVFAWKGIRVPEDIIRWPQELTVQRILGEKNAEVRRVMIERYGQDRFVLDADAKVLDTSAENSLLSIPLESDPDFRLVALKLRCPSTSAVYIVRVPPYMQKVKEALAWSFGLDSARDYVLEMES